jgi:hypothetical protein
MVLVPAGTSALRLTLPMFVAVGFYFAENSSVP